MEGRRQYGLDFDMGFFKSEFARFFTFGFAGGALLVLAAIGLNPSSSIANGIVPPAQAAQADQ